MVPGIAAGSFLQLGAFASRTNAEAARSRIAALLDGLPIELVDERGLFKLLAGPFGTRDAAQLAERIGQATGSRPFVVSR